MDVKTDGEPTDPIVAVFKDNSTAHITDLTCGAYKAMSQKSRNGRRPASFTGFHCVSNHKVVIHRRPDAILLLVMLEQQKQILQVRVDKFPGIDIEEQERAASKFMAALAAEYCEDKVSKIMLTQRRNEEYKKLELQRGQHSGAQNDMAGSSPEEAQAAAGKPIRKRPAAALGEEYTRDLQAAAQVSKRPAMDEPDRSNASCDPAEKDETSDNDDDDTASSCFDDMSDSPDCGDIGNALAKLSTC